MTECICGCGVVPHLETEILKAALERAGITCEQLTYCNSRYTVIGHVSDVQENQVVDKVEAIKGVDFKYVIDAHAMGYTIHCEVQL